MECEKKKKPLRLQKRMLFVLLFSFFLLVLLGGLVRSTGSGMGCPDWPRCYGRWIPPAHPSALPAHYRALFFEKRQEKVRRLATFLGFVGLHGLQKALLHSKIVQKDEAFNPSKAWIEYINRMLGAWVGLLSLALCIYAARYTRKEYGRAFAYLLASLFLIVIQGLLGAVVVVTHLLPVLVTLHMLLPFFILTTLLCAARALTEHPSIPPLPLHKGFQRRFILTFWVALCAFFFQVLVGTQLREKVDTLLLAGLERASVPGHLGNLLYTHGLLGCLPFALYVLLLHGCRKYRVRGALRRYTLLTASIYLLQMLLGASLYHFALPTIFQPLHLLLPFFLMSFHLLLYEAFRHRMAA